MFNDLGTLQQEVKKEYTGSMLLNITEALLQIQTTTMDDDLKFKIKQWILSNAPTMVCILMKTNFLKVPANLVIFDYAVIKNEIADLFNETFMDELKKWYKDDTTKDNIITETSLIVSMIRDHALRVLGNIAWDIILHLPTHIARTAKDAKDVFSEQYKVVVKEIELASHIGSDATYVVVFETTQTVVKDLLTNEIILF